MLLFPECGECRSSTYVLLYLNNKHVLSSSLKVHHPLSLVDTQRLLLCTHGISPVQDDEDVCVCAGSKHVTGEDFNLIGNNCKIQKYLS